MLVIGLATGDGIDEVPWKQKDFRCADAVRATTGDGDIHIGWERLKLSQVESCGRDSQIPSRGRAFMARRAAGLWVVRRLSDHMRQWIL